MSTEWRESALAFWLHVAVVVALFATGHWVIALVVSVDLTQYGVRS